jgi:sugar O-acyltransferase (sialic acid O-acetyltransferase NeuD family)
VSGKPILLLGAGGHARACIDVIELEARFVVSALIGLPHEVGTAVLGYPVVGSDMDVPKWLSDCSYGLVSMGQIKTPEPRIRLFDILERSGFRLPTIVSPRAYVSRHASLGAGTIVLHGAVINAGAVIGRNCIINSQALVEHDAQIADHCHISTATAINSGARVGSGTFIGSGSSVRQGAVIGDRCVIGMAQRVLEGCEAGTRMPPLKTVEAE